jgi:hypothetical protein
LLRREISASFRLLVHEMRLGLSLWSSSSYQAWNDWDGHSQDSDIVLVLVFCIMQKYTFDTVGFRSGHCWYLLSTYWLHMIGWEQAKDGFRWVFWGFWSLNRFLVGFNRFLMGLRWAVLGFMGFW